MKNKEEIIQKLLASMLVFVMFMAQIALVGLTAFTYAIDMIATNSNNVEFMAYFEEGTERTTELSKRIDETAKLNLYVAVKNEGYLSNGKISLENAGFKIKEDSIRENEYVDKVENNEIYLKQLNAEDQTQIQVEVQMIEDSEINRDLLNKETNVRLTGTYYSSRDNVQINGNGIVKINWIAPSTVKSEIAGKVITNYIYTVGEANKRVVQLLVASKLENNSYPVKSTQIDLDLPNGVEEVEVHKRTTSATNGNKDFSVNNNSEQNKLTITVLNEEVNGKISWVKNSRDLFVVTLKFPETTDVTSLSVKVNNKLTLYNTEETVLLGEEQNITLNEQKEGIVSSEIKEFEQDIYKGKIYSGEDRNYITGIRANVDYAEGIEGITINEKEAVFERTNTNNEKEELSSNVQYKKVAFNKNNIESILGQEWTIDITDQNQVKKTITNETTADEKGNIIVELENNAKSLKIETTKVKSNGFLEIQNYKSISKTEYTRDDIKAFEKIKDKVSIEYTRNGQNTETETIIGEINLKDTETKAELTISKENLSTLYANENVEVEATLKTNGENYNLYKSPEVEIIFPKEINGVRVVSAEASDKNGLEVENNRLYRKDDGRIALYVKFSGEQTEYIEKEMKLKLVLNLNADILTSQDSKANIEMTYTNENDGSNLNTSKEISFESKHGVLLYNNLFNYNSASENTITIDENEVTAKLDREAGEKEITLDTAILNNYDREINNITLIGKVPTQNESNTFTAGINRITTDKPSRIYYSNNINAQANDTSWTEENNNAVAYKIVIEKIDPKENVKIESKISIPANLGYNQVGKITEDLSYTYSDREIRDNSNIILKTDESLQGQNSSSPLNTQVATGLDAEIKAKRGTTELNDGDNVYEGENIKYTITIKNTSGQDYSNINVKTTQTNGKVWKLTEVQMYNEYYESIGENANPIEHRYIPSNSNEITFEKIESLKNGETITLTYESTIDLFENAENQKTFGLIKITTDDGSIDKEIKTIENNIKDAELKVEMYENVTREDYWTTDAQVRGRLEITNLTDADLNNLEVKVSLSNNLICEGKVYLIYEPDDIELEDKGFEKNDKGETIITLKINKLPGKAKKNIWITPFAEDSDKDEMITMVGNVKTETGNSYFSGELERTAYTVSSNIELNQKAYINGKEVDKDTIAKDDDEIEFLITVKNKNDRKTNISISDGVVNGLDITGVIFTQKNVESDKSSEYTGDNEDNKAIVISSTLDENEEVTLRIKTKLNTIVQPDNKFENQVDVVTLENYRNYSNVLTLNTNKVFSNGEADDVNNQEEQNNNEQNNNEQNNEEQNGENEQNQNNNEQQEGNNNNGKENNNIDINDEENKENGGNNGNNGNNNSEENKAEKFDMKLEKYVSKVTVTNKEGTKTYNFNKESNIPKIEIKGKYLSGSVVLVEYTLRVSNVGEVDGYVGSIMDKMPSSLKYQSSLNSDWYIKNNTLYNDKLADEKIEAGSSKEVKLILTKTMTASNTGLFRNTANILNVHNDKAINESDSGNNESSGDVIITVSTGETVQFIIYTLVITALIIAGSGIIVKKFIIK